MLQGKGFGIAVHLSQVAAAQLQLLGQIGPPMGGLTFPPVLARCPGWRSAATFWIWSSHPSSITSRGTVLVASNSVQLAASWRISSRSEQMSCHRLSRDGSLGGTGIRAPNRCWRIQGSRRLPEAMVAAVSFRCRWVQRPP
ncbi:MAG: hypothetical protein ACKOPT_13585, partial [Cyanobium sp.]